MSLGSSLPIIVEGDCAVTEMASLQPSLVDEQQIDTNHRQQGTVLDIRAVNPGPQHLPTVDEVVGTSLPTLGMLMPKLVHHILEIDAN